MQEAFGESFKKQALTQNLVLSYLDASGMNCISVALVPKLVMLPGRYASLSEDDADRGAFLSSGASSGALKTRLSLLVCVSLPHSLIAVTSGRAARRIEA